MHNALGVAVVKGLEDFEHVVANVEVTEALVEFAEIGVARVNELSNNGWRFCQGVTYDINQLNDVYTVLQSLQNLDFSPDLVLFD